MLISLASHHYIYNIIVSSYIYTCIHELDSRSIALRISQAPHITRRINNRAYTRIQRFKIPPFPRINQAHERIVIAAR